MTVSMNPIKTTAETAIGYRLSLLVLVYAGVPIQLQTDIQSANWLTTFDISIYIQIKITRLIFRDILV